MKIGDLSRSTGVTIPTIRLYEKEGLIGAASRTDGKFRVFSEEHRTRLILIKRMRTLGFSLEQVRNLIKTLESRQTSEIEYVLDELAKDTLWRVELLQKLFDTTAAANRSSVDLSQIEAVLIGDTR